METCGLMFAGWVMQVLDFAIRRFSCCSLVVLALGALPFTSTAGEMDRSAAQARRLDDAARAGQLKELGWGMFICWSTSSFSGKEWTRDIPGPEFFRASGCDTDQWCRTAKEAEMGYILFLAKHHDGLCMWDTNTTDKKVTNSPLGIDVLARLKQSCDKYGLKLALYFSEGDWTYPKEDQVKQAEIKKGQLRELLTGYGPIEFFWMDAAGGKGGVSHEDTVDYVHQFQPNTFVGFNHGPVAGRLRLGESRMAGPLDSSDPKYCHPTLKQGAEFDVWKLAEITYPMFNGRSPSHSGFGNWFYTKAADAGIVISPEFIYRDYLECKKYDTLLDLNVGPMRNGRLRPIDIGVLHQVGRYIRGEDHFREWVSWDAEATVSSAAEGKDFWHKHYGPSNAFDELEQTYWMAADGDDSPTIEFTLKSPAEIQSFSLSEPEGNNSIQDYRLQAQVDGAWQTVHSGSGVLSSKEIALTPAATAQRFRLVIDRHSDGLRLSSLKLYE